MMRYIIKFFLFIFIIKSLFPQEVEITKIIDSNLFELKNGERIKLANLEIPSIYNPDTLLADFASYVKKFSEDVLLKKQLSLEYAEPVDSTLDVHNVHLYKKYVLNIVDYNEMYLEKGMGKLLEPVGEKYQEKYLKAASEAKEQKRGIWNLKKFVKKCHEKSFGWKGGVSYSVLESESIYGRFGFSLGFMVNLWQYKRSSLRLEVFFLKKMSIERNEEIKVQSMGYYFRKEIYDYYNSIGYIEIPVLFRYHIKTIKKITFYSILGFGMDIAVCGKSESKLISSSDIYEEVPGYDPYEFPATDPGVSSDDIFLFNNSGLSVYIGFETLLSPVSLEFRYIYQLHQVDWIDYHYIKKKLHSFIILFGIYL